MTTCDRIIQTIEEIPTHFLPALTVLAEAAHYAEQTGGDWWEFAVEIKQLRKLGLSSNDLRFLVRMKVVEHAREVTEKGQDGRRFQSTGDLTFAKRTCFVLTSQGRTAVSVYQKLRVGHGAAIARFADNSMVVVANESNQVPQWDASQRILFFDDQIVKQFKWHAINQEAILAAFEEEGWPARIDDPLAPQPDQDSKRRLSDTIKCLNRKQLNQLLHFRGDGTGEGVIWESVESNNLHQAVNPRQKISSSVAPKRLKTKFA